jgi:hypothetical protein
MRGEMDSTSKGGWLIRAYFYDQAGTYISLEDAASCSGTTSCSPGLAWTKRTGTFTAPSGAAFMKIAVLFWRGGGWITYDDLTIE